MLEVKTQNIISQEVKISGALLALNIHEGGSYVRITAGGQTCTLDSKAVSLKEVCEAFEVLSRCIRSQTGFKKERKKRDPNKKKKRLDSAAVPAIETASAGPRRVIL